MAANRTIIQVAGSVAEWCLPSHGILSGCESEALSRPVIQLHTNLAVAVTVLAVLIDLGNLLIRKLYFRDKFNVFSTTLLLHVIGATGAPIENVLLCATASSGPFS